MKVKIFKETNIFELEESVNDFIDDKKVKQISYSTYMDGITFYSCMILYNDNGDH